MIVTTLDRALTRACIIVGILATAGFFTGFIVATPLTAGLAAISGLAGWFVVDLLEKKIERQ